MAENAARVDWAGVGVRLAQRFTTPRSIGLAVERAVADARIRARARELAVGTRPTTRPRGPPTSSNASPAAGWASPPPDSPCPARPTLLGRLLRPDRASRSGVAQRQKHSTVNRRVVGSNPTPGSFQLHDGAHGAPFGRSTGCLAVASPDRRPARRGSSFFSAPQVALAGGAAGAFGRERLASRRSACRASSIYATRNCRTPPEGAPLGRRRRRAGPRRRR